MAETGMFAEPRDSVELADINNLDRQEGASYGITDIIDIPMDFNGDEIIPDLVDYDDNDNDDYYYTYPNRCEGQRPVGTYDPFDHRFPRHELEQIWGEGAVEFIWGSLQSREDWEYMIESICEPFSEWDGDYWRTRNWFNALDFDVQMEIWIQRNLGVRPGSRWILGPHDDQIPELWNQYEAGRYVTVDIRYPGSSFGYGYLHPHQSSLPELAFPDIIQDSDLEAQVILVN